MYRYCIKFKRVAFSRMCVHSFQPKKLPLKYDMKVQRGCVFASECTRLNDEEGSDVSNGC